MVRIASNPIVRLELLRRFRSPVAAWGIPLLALLPGIAVSIAYSTGTSRVSSNDFSNAMMAFGPDGQPIEPVSTGVSVSQITSFGLPMYITLFSTVLVVLLVLVPAVVGGSISSERNNDTLQPLQITALSPLDIVIGKLVASLAYLFLLLLCLTPAMAAPFLVGGVPASHVAVSFGILLLVCVELAAVALAVSAVMSRAATSIVASLLATGVLVVGPLAAMALAFWSSSRSGPFEARLSVLRLIGAASPVALFSWTGRIGSVDPGDFAGTSGRVWALVAWGIVTVGALLVARRAVTAPRERDR